MLSRKLFLLSTTCHYTSAQLFLSFDILTKLKHIVGVVVGGFYDGWQSKATPLTWGELFHILYKDRAAKRERFKNTLSKFDNPPQYIRDPILQLPFSYLSIYCKTVRFKLLNLIASDPNSYSLILHTIAVLDYIDLSANFLVGAIFSITYTLWQHVGYYSKQGFNCYLTFLQLSFLLPILDNIALLCSVLFFVYHEISVNIKLFPGHMDLLIYSGLYEGMFTNIMGGKSAQVENFDMGLFSVFWPHAEYYKSHSTLTARSETFNRDFKDNEKGGVAGKILMIPQLVFSDWAVFSFACRKDLCRENSLASTALATMNSLSECSFAVQATVARTLQATVRSTVEAEIPLFADIIMQGARSVFTQPEFGYC
jgi:hypothetical protein